MVSCITEEPISQKRVLSPLAARPLKSTTRAAAPKKPNFAKRINTALMVRVSISLGMLRTRLSEIQSMH